MANSYAGGWKVYRREPGLIPSFSECSVVSANVHVRFTETRSIGPFRVRNLTSNNIIKFHSWVPNSANTGAWYCEELNPGYSERDLLMRTLFRPGLKGSWDQAEKLSENNFLRLIITIKNRYYLLEMPRKYVKCFAITFVYKRNEWNGYYFGKLNAACTQELKSQGVRTVRWRMEPFLQVERATVHEFSERYGSGNCTITTAVLTHHAGQHSSDLPILRSYRREWLETFTLGKLLSAWYDKWSPPVAEWLTKRKRTSMLLMTCFIHPCAWTINVTMECPSAVRTAARVLVMVWYVAGALTATALRMCQHFLQRKK